MKTQVGIGVDAGEAVPVDGGYCGGALKLAARLCALADPEQVLASEGIMRLAGTVSRVASIPVYARVGSSADLRGRSAGLRVVMLTRVAYSDGDLTPRLVTHDAYK